MLQSKLMNGTIVGFFTASQWLGARIGPYCAKKRNVTIERDRRVQTWEGHEVLVDIYTPRGTRPESGWPIALVTHGGGWRFFSKDSHALVAAQIAEMGYLTVATDYRLAPLHPYPRGLIDVLSVYDWIHAQARNLGGDLKNVAVIGESAGASFSLAICLLASGLASPQHILDERFGNRKLDWSVPKKAIIHCGFHQVSNPLRYHGKISTIVRCRLEMIQRNYLPQSLKDLTRKHWGLADPLLILEELAESGFKITNAFPDIFIPVGEKDPVLEDSVRLAKVFEKLGCQPQFKVYPKAPHSFYAMPWHKEYDRCWNDIGAFLRLPG